LFCFFFLPSDEIGKQHLGQCDKCGAEHPAIELQEMDKKSLCKNCFVEKKEKRAKKDKAKYLSPQ
jgi:formylmethanofuran dehydrogenase subunit E